MLVADETPAHNANKPGRSIKPSGGFRSRGGAPPPMTHGYDRHRTITLFAARM